MGISFRQFLVLFAIFLSLGLFVACGGSDDSVVTYPKTSEMAGDWQVHNLFINNSTGRNYWMIANATVTSSGAMTLTYINTLTGPTGMPQGMTFGVMADGTVHRTDISNDTFHGYMNINDGSDLIVATAGDGPQNGSEVQLMFWQRMDSATHQPTDLDGEWKAAVLTVNNSPEAHWIMQEIEVSSSGNFVAVNSTFDGFSTAGPAGILNIETDGGVTTDANPSFDGFLSARNDLFVAIQNSGNPDDGADIVVGMRGDYGTVYNAADMAGRWRIHEVTAGMDDNISWTHGYLDIGLDGRVTGRQTDSWTQVERDMIDPSDIPAGLDIQMVGLINAPRAGYVTVGGRIVNTSNHEVEVESNGPIGSDTYRMFLSGNKKMAVLVANAPDGKYQMSILQKDSCDSSVCFPGLSARTSDLLGQWRANWMLITNNPVANISLWGIFNANMTTDGVVSVGFSNMLNPWTGMINTMEDLLPPGEGPQGAVLRVDQDGRVWSAKSYYEDLVGFINSTGDTIVGVAGKQVAGMGTTESQMITIQKIQAGVTYDFSTDMPLDSVWKMLNYTATGWDIINAVVTNTTVSDNGDCLTTISNTAGGPPVGTVAGVSLELEGGFAFDNSVACSAPLDLPDIHGFMSSDKNTIFGVGNFNSGKTPQSWSLVRVLNSPGSYTQSDLAGDWWVSNIRTGIANDFGYGYGKISISGSGLITGSIYNPLTHMFDVVGDEDKDGTQDISMKLTMSDTSTGDVSMSGAVLPGSYSPVPDMRVFISADKSMLFILEGTPGKDFTGGSKVLRILQKYD